MKTKPIERSSSKSLSDQKGTEKTDEFVSTLMRYPLFVCGYLSSNPPLLKEATKRALNEINVKTSSGHVKRLTKRAYKEYRQVIFKAYAEFVADALKEERDTFMLPEMQSKFEQITSNLQNKNKGKIISLDSSLSLLLKEGVELLRRD